MTLSERLNSLVAGFDELLNSQLLKHESAHSLRQKVTETHRVVTMLARFGLDAASQEHRNGIASRVTEVEAWVNEIGNVAKNEVVALRSLAQVKDWVSSIDNHRQNLMAAAFNAVVWRTAEQISELGAPEIEEKYEVLKEESNSLEIFIKETLQGKINRLSTLVDTTVSTLDAKKQAMDTAIASVGIEKYQNEFGTTASTHKKVGYGWLLATFLSLLATAVAPLIIHKNFPLQPGLQGEWLTLENINVTTAKVVLVFTLLFIISLCIKNYRANRHLQVVNLHRSIALLTFKTFVEGAGEDDAVKKQILLEATKTVFSQGASGYSPSENDGPDARLIEIIQTIKK